MSHFFLIASSLLLAAHGYFFWKLRQAFGGGLWQIPVLLFVSFMLCLLLFRRQALLSGLPHQVTEFSYIWFGFLLFACFLFLALDLLTLSLFLLKKISGGSLTWSLSPARGVPLCLLLAFGLAAYAFYAAHNPQIRHVSIHSAKLPAEFSGPGRHLRIVQLTDIHLSENLGPEFLRKVADLVESQRPDIIAVTGDLVDTDMRGRSEDAAILRSLTARYGKYAVLGNHEVYRGLASARRFIADSGLILLENRAVLDPSGIVVAGVNDPAMREWVMEEGGEGGEYRAPDPVAIVKTQDVSRFVLLLKHRPKVEEAGIGLIDLQLSGHTHGGQIWPGKYLVLAANNHVRQGLTVYSREGRGETRLYLSNGIGYWGPPMRFLTPSEITVIDLIGEEE